MAKEQRPIDKLAMDQSSLFREVIVTDRRIGTIRISNPITANGADDPERQTIYAGETQIMTPMGALPIAFQIEAHSLAEAVEKYGDAGKVAVEKAIKELQEMRREQTSSIVLPGSMSGVGTNAGPGGGFKLP
ncbi:MAG: hypothetical protein O3B03_00870 [Proteobacteria bacterium]|nr:hypothetical protein [Pseudomonadota bacterium]MDA1331294.1 hypothetical protein [Pseudomonadota bacterium]